MKLCVLTGGSQGLGKEILLLLEKEGWVVYEVSRTGTSKNHITFDLNDVAHIDGLLETLTHKIKNKSIEEMLFINNAAQVGPIRRASLVEKEELLRSLNVNIMASLVLIHGFVRTFRSAAIHKTILNISTGAAKKGYAGWSLYCAGKAAVDNYINALYEEEQNEPLPYRVVNVNPFVMDTAMQDCVRAADIADFPQQPRFVQFKEDHVLLPPRTVAEAIMVLIKDNQRPGPAFDVKAYLEQR